MNSNREVGFSAVLGGMALGVTAGALAVILSDKKNRDHLSKKAEDAKLRVQESVAVLKGKGENAVLDMKDNFENDFNDMNKPVKKL